ncbi:MAG: bifunctional [glutamate--ammonia ligase]-adenylyl-L-tyrosine phosphorylase/[glutamate--ammonia-ligase] adenylyltransferase [Sandaracinaceae bacterium]
MDPLGHRPPDAADLHPEGQRRALEAFRDTARRPPEAAEERVLRALADHAPALLPLALRDPDIVASLAGDGLEVPFDPGAGAASFAERLGEASEADLASELRRARHLGLCRIALREALGGDDVRATAAEMSDLAATLVDAALRHVTRAAEERFGRPLDADGSPIPLTVLGMGKLGGRELNLGSDIDVCFFYGTDDGEVEGGDRTVHQHFARIAQRTCRLLSDVTEDGFCFRVDLRLRPEGSRGPLVNSLASAERYYATFGRTWERAALLRASPIAGDLAFGERMLSVLRPFVYRRAVDPRIAEAMEDMLLRSRRELDVDPEADVKLGRGGIREAEFFVQTLQLVWGGQHPELQVPATLTALRRLLGAGLITDREAEALTEAWVLLRRVEHRIHVWAGYQTHALPPEGDERDRFGRSLGFDDGEHLTAVLEGHREEVAALFASLAPDAEREESLWDPLLDRVAAGASAADLLPWLDPSLFRRDPLEAATHLTRLGRHANAPLGPVTRERAPGLGRLLLTEVAEAADPETALRLLADFLTRLVGPWSYERLLLEDPRLTRRLIGLFGTSATLGAALVGHPEDIDRLLSTRGAPPTAELRADHDALIAPLSADSDPEDLVRELRALKRLHTLEVGLAQAAGELDLEAATERLSELAEGQIRVALAAAGRWAQARWGRPRGRGLVVCAMGKLGGRELGFGGDLDLVFLYGEDGETEPTERGRSTSAAELFTRTAQRTMKLLREPDAEGPGYETDTRLRPSGSQGTLVVSLAAFDAYHAGGAAAWERQALLRARPVAGDPDLARDARERFARIAYGGAAGAPDREELAATRRRLEVELADERPGRVHPKLGYGALVDVEFLAQGLQMAHGDDPRVRTPNTPAAVRALAVVGALTSTEARALLSAYAFFRQVEQALWLRRDEHRAPLLTLDGRSGTFVARHLSLQARDGLPPEDVLRRTYYRHAERTRRLFEARIAPVGTAPPWSA